MLLRWGMKVWGCVSKYVMHTQMRSYLHTRNPESIDRVRYESPQPTFVMMTLLAGLSPLLQRASAFGVDAPLGTGLEWMTVAAVVLPALVLVVLAYLGPGKTV